MLKKRTVDLFGIGFVVTILVMHMFILSLSANTESRSIDRKMKL